MPLTRDQVLHIARLARLGVTDADVEKAQQQLSQILDSFATLAEVDTTDVPPTMSAVPLANVMRDDVARPSFARDEVIANAPTEEDGYFRVRAVLE